MKRSEQRESIFKLIFRAEFYPVDEMEEQIQLYTESLKEASDKEIHYIKEKAGAVMDKLDEVDQILGEASEGWKITRIGKAELAILRLAIYELKFDEDIPTGVAINEAVELAKVFGADQTSKFVNGVLAKLA